MRSSAPEAPPEESVDGPALAPGSVVPRPFAALCLLVLLAVPLARIVWPPAAGAEGHGAFVAFAAAVPATGEVLARRGPVVANRFVQARIDDFERGLERGSALLRLSLPAVQQLLTRWGGVGNEQVYTGRDGWLFSGWLFYRPGVDYLIGPPFRDPEVLERRRRAAESWVAAPHPDPLPALLDLHRQLAAREIALVVVPVPSKAMVYPELLAPAASWNAGGEVWSTPQNPSFAAFVAALVRAGVEVLDPAPLLAAARHTGGEPLFLRTDSHWSPAGVETTALAVAEHLAARGFGAPQTALRRTPQPVTGQGDLLRMLRLPADQALYPPETVTLSRVVTSDGEAWRPDPAARILLLGDSFTNVFSRPHLGWGTSAGFAEQVAFFLGEPLDRLAVDDGGATETRRRLAQEMAAGHDRLAGKEVVVYQVAVRELAFGDWREVELPAPSTAATPSAAASEPVAIQGEILEIVRVPPPSTTPYRDAIVALRLAVSGAGELAEDEVLVYLWGMRDGELTAAAHYRVGQELAARLVPWSTVAPELESFRRLELPGDAAFLLTPYWAADHEPEEP